jgi:hypothetical protein
MDKKLTTSEILIVAGGAGALVGSFLPWMEAFGADVNAWDSGMFPTYTWVGIFGLLAALAVILPKYANVNLPDRILGFTLNQVLLELTFIAALLVLSFLLVDKGGADMGIGFFLSLLGAGAAVAGAWMIQNEVRPAGGMGGMGGGPAAPPSAPPPPPPPV